MCKYVCVNVDDVDIYLYVMRNVQLYVYSPHDLVCSGIGILH